MKALSLIVPIFLGILIVLQAGLNRKIALSLGLPGTVFLNAVVLLGGAGVLLFYAQHNPELFQRPEVQQLQFAWWWLLPGLFGLTLVFGAPFAVSRWGASQTFIAIISAQLLMSLIWDWKIENLEMSWPRIAGCALVWVGVILANI